MSCISSKLMAKIHTKVKSHVFQPSVFTEREVQEYMEARKLHAIIGCPPECKFKELVSKKLLKNCPITTNQIANAQAIFDHDLPKLRGATMHRKWKNRQAICGDTLGGDGS